MSATEKMSAIENSCLLIYFQKKKKSLWPVALT